VSNNYIEKYIVCGNTEFYPWIYVYDTLEEAEKAFDKNDPFEEDVFLCKILKHKEDYEGIY